MRVSRLGPAILACLVLWTALPARAQDDRFDVQRFRPMPSQRSNFFTQAGSAVMPHLGFELGLVFNYADDPLVVRDDADDVIGRLVAGQLNANVIAALALADRLEIGLDLQITMFQHGEEVALLPGAEADGAAGLGDLRLVPKVLLFTQVAEDSHTGVGLALLLDAYLPVGDDANYQGEGFRMHPRLVLDYALSGGSVLGLNLGYAVRPERSLAGIEVDDTFSIGLAADVALNEQFSLVPEVSADIAVLAHDLGPEDVPFEVLVGAKYWANDTVMAELGMGTGVLPGFGTPDWRIFLGLTYSRTEEPTAPEPTVGDRDGDGTLDNDDSCPDEPEDRDDFQDQDGCPDPDNDRDTIPDIDDACPLDPEDVDLFEDADGCPEPDNDLDGVLDLDDMCPADPEDIDLFEDNDGCPDPDNDQDRIPDMDDVCPNDPETYNGTEDEDGCPDDGQITIVRCTELELGDSVYFDSDSDVIQERSYPLLFSLTNALDANPSILRVRIEGHTDDRGSDTHNLDLSRRRAASVVRFLVAAGIDAQRLESEGYGEERPIESNDTAEGRQNNRRVEARILEQEGCE